jgi:hemoglobin-like flavoprotein
MNTSPQISQEGLNQVLESWGHIKALDESLETQGVILFKHIFTIAPAALQLFKSFKDEPNMYEFPRMRRHAAGVLKGVEQALLDFAGFKATLNAIGAKHVPRGVQIPHFAIVKQALVKTLQDALGDNLTPELTGYWATCFDMIAAEMQRDNWCTTGA